MTDFKSSMCQKTADVRVLSRFDGQTRLLVSVLSENSGAHKGLRVLQKQRRFNSRPSLHNLLETLCREDVWLENESQPLEVKPLVCLLPVTFKCNLLSFLHMVSSTLPQSQALCVLECLEQESCPNPWVTALIRQLRRDLGGPGEEPLCTPQCSQRLQGLSECLADPGQTRGWAKCFSGPKDASPSGHPSETSDAGTQRKRRTSVMTLDSDDEEIGQDRKRLKMDVSPMEGVCDSEGPQLERKCVREETPERNDFPTDKTSAELLEPATDNTCESLPEHIKASIPQIKELLESFSEWDQSPTDVLKVLNECDPNQAKVLCGLLNLPDTPEQTLPKLCSCLLALSPDLSHSTAVTLIKSLLLRKVISLSESASRCLVTAVTSLCSRYPRPTCCALIRPALEENDLGNPQAELLNRLIDCLEPHYRLLVFQMTFGIVWTEPVLSVVHSLLDSKLELNEDIFKNFTKQLISQAPQFTKSMKFAKMMLTILTKYNSHVTSLCKHSLSCCLTTNETFLKKSLQAALKKITP
ncbi:Fanconi anemia group E protein [Lampris incognitus]|uniref:Fanconi anemia group E protein n=1 Tax=Lampris incognitus TaxID=2546036 RepID=UPI0024B5C8AD|nr:Fanconi anemia group E protein [Lampris incognitus]